MSSSNLVNAESIQLLVGTEPSPGTSPTIWQALEPNPGGLKDFYLKRTKIQPRPLSRRRQINAPQTVDADAMPGLTHDLTKDLQDAFGEAWTFAKTKHTGGTGQALWSTRDSNLTARTSSAFTVSANGALQSGTIVIGKGWLLNPNNTPLVVGSSATGTSIPVSAGVAETPSGYVATLEVGGFQGASGDIAIDASGNITSTVADFTTMGIPVGIKLWVGDGVGTAFSFATAAYYGAATVTAVTANLITLARRMWTVGSADTGTGKTIRLLWGLWLRNVGYGDTDYQTPTNQMELTYTKLSAGTTDEFVYLRGLQPDQLKISAPLKNFVTAETSFVGTTIDDPTTSRASGASTAAGSLAIQRYNTTSNVFHLKVANKSTEVTVSDDIDTWDLTLMNHVTGQKQQGTLGNRRTVVGEFEVQLSANALLVDDTAIKACSNDTPLTFGVGLRNGDGGLFLDVPSAVCTQSPPAFPQNGAITLALQLGAFRDATTNYTLGISTWPYLPAV